MSMVANFSGDWTLYYGGPNVGYKATVSNDQSTLFIKGNPAQPARIYLRQEWRLEVGCTGGAGVAGPSTDSNSGGDVPFLLALAPGASPPGVGSVSYGAAIVQTYSEHSNTEQVTNNAAVVFLTDLRQPGQPSAGCPLTAEEHLDGFAEWGPDRTYRIYADWSLPLD